MDPITHTLVGASLAQAGLKRRTPLGTATLLIGANLPDVDVVAYARGHVVPLAVRRGWTHGVLAMVVLPLVLTGAVLAWDRLVRRRRTVLSPPPAVPREVLLLATVAVLTHPLLDLLNTYGVRLLMPFSHRWFYGDVLYIADPWVWLLLGVGVILASVTARQAPARSARYARWALACTAGYMALMLVSSLAAGASVRRALTAAGVPVRRVMIGPEAVTPFRKHVVADVGDRYLVGNFDWTHRPAITVSALTAIPTRSRQLAARRAAATRVGKMFLSWARFPFFEVEAADDGYRVHIIDARYTVSTRARFGAVTVEVPRP